MTDHTPLHLIKLCVGASTVDDLARWIELRMAQMTAAGIVPHQFHTTRQMPKAREDILAGGSLYWVVAGFIQCRQRVIDLVAVEGEDGIRRCNIILEPKIQLVRPAPRRPFQGWRYLKHHDAPEDIQYYQGDGDMPPDMQKELIELGLL